MLHVYLDTSFWSELTRAGRATTATSPRSSDNWRALRTGLLQKVRREVLVCPASEFPMREVQCASELLREYTSLQRELSRDMYFKRWEDILVHQVADQALICLGRPQDIDPKWSVFTHEPPFVPGPLETKRMKQSVTGYAEDVKPLREKYGRKMSHKKHLEDEKKVFLGATFLNPSCNFPMMLIYEAGVSEEEVPMLFSFLDDKSNDFGPFIDIYCSLWASTYIHEPERKPQPGDSLDIVALACAIPYCQIITTDNNMKNIAKRLKFEEKYGIEIYSPANEDLDALTASLSSF